MPGSGFSSTARQQAQDILSRPPYRSGPDRTPRPLAGVFHAIGRALQVVVARPARWLYHHVLLHIGHGFHTAFGSWWPVVAVALALAAGAGAALLVIRRRAGVEHPASTAAAPAPTEDAGQLERRAAEAEAAGDHETAVRLRFRAGLLRLARRGLLADYDARTDRELSAQLASVTFDRLASSHEGIVFGGRPATGLESEDARRSWPLVADEVRAGAAAPSP